MTQKSHGMAVQTSLAEATGERTAVRGPSRTLLVEDDYEYRTKLTRFLEQGGLVINPARSGSEAMLLAQQKQYQTVVLDLRLSDMTPDAVYKRLRERQEEEFRLFILTAYPRDLDEYQELREKSVKVITKDNDERFFKMLLKILKGREDVGGYLESFKRAQDKVSNMSEKKQAASEEKKKASPSSDRSRYQVVATHFPNAYTRAELRKIRTKDYIVVIERPENRVVRIIEGPYGELVDADMLYRAFRRKYLEVVESYEMDRYEVVIAQGNAQTLRVVFPRVQGWKAVQTEELEL